jgi:hypothetical protein
LQERQIITRKSSQSLAGLSRTLTSKLKNLPTIPLVIGSVVAVMGCLALTGMAYAVLVPPSGGVSARPTATRLFVTATPILTSTPTPTNTAMPTPTDLPTDIPPDTPVPPTRVPSTRVPPTAVPPTAPPPTEVLGADLGLSNIRFSVTQTTQGKGLGVQFFYAFRNDNGYAIPFGYLGVAAQDADGFTVAFSKSRINSSIDAYEKVSIHGTFKVYRQGNFNAYLVICLSANDDACDLPGADYRRLAGPIAITIT